MDNSFIEKAATCFGLGDAKFMPGTVGTLGGIPLALLFSLTNDRIYFYFMVMFIFFSVFVSAKAEKIYGEKDSQNIVIDEVAGYLVTMFMIDYSGYGFLGGVIAFALGFLYFRIFDITKLPPIKQIQDIEGGIGVVIDDILAGIYANVLLFVTLPLILNLLK